MRTSSRSSIFRLAVGAAVTSSGDEAGFIALAYAVFIKTNSAFWLSGTLLVTVGLSGLVAPLAGIVADRFDRRRIILIANAIGCFFWILLASTDVPALMLGCALVAALSGAFSHPAFASAIPNVAPEEDLHWANAILSIGHNLSHLAGPFIGGLLITVVEPRVLFLFNAATFLVAGIMVWSVRVPFQQPREEGAARERGAIWEGFRFVSRNRVLRGLVVGWVLVTVAIDIALVADLPLALSFGAGPAGYGLLEGMFGAGAILGAWWARKLTRKSDWWAIFLESGVTAVGYALIAVSPWFGVALIVSGITGIADALGAVAGATLIQRTTTDDVRGRVFAAVDMIYPIGNIIAFAIGGPLLAWLGPRSVFMAGAIFGVAATIAMWPPIKRLRALSNEPESEPDRRNS